MHPRMCMHVLGCIAAVTATVIFCRGHCRGHDGNNDGGNDRDMPPD